MKRMAGTAVAVVTLLILVGECPSTATVDQHVTSVSPVLPTLQPPIPTYH